MTNIIQLSKPCAFCDSRENVQLFAGLMLCGNCQGNIGLPILACLRPMIRLNKKTELIWFLIKYSIFMYEKFFGLIIQVVTTYIIMKKKKIIFNL
jgi:hypothetical protein